MKSKFIKCPAILFAALLGSATSTLLRGDYALRSPRRILEKKHESSSAIDDAGRKNTNSYAKGSKKSSKKNGNLEHADVSIAVGEIGPKETQIVHSHHPKAAEKDDPNSETSDAKGASNKAIKQVVHSHHPKGAEVHPELHDSEGKKSKNGRRSFKKRSENDETTVVENQSVLSRVYDTQDFSLNDEEDGNINIVGRPIEVLAFDYSTRSNKLPSEVETLYLVHLTEQFLDNMYAKTFEGVETIKFEGLEVQRYKPISSRMIQFEITALFQATNDSSAPAIAEVKNVVQEGMKHGGAFYADYLTSLEQMPFDVFSTTVSCHVVTDADELESLMNFQAGRVDDDRPPVVLLCAVFMASLSVCVCLVTWFHCVRRAKNKSATEYATPYNSEGITNFKTATFDDLVPEKGYFVDEADSESAEASNLVEVELTDDYESVEESEWTDETCTRSQASNGDCTEESQDSAISALRKWIPGESCGREREQPLEQSNQSSTQCIEKCSQESSDLTEPLRPSIISCQAQNQGREVDTVCHQKFTIRQTVRNGMTNADQNAGSKFVPQWMIKRQEIMRRREQQCEIQQLLHCGSEGPGVETDGPLSASKKAANDTSKVCGALHSQESLAGVPKSAPIEQHLSQNPIRNDEPAPVFLTPLSCLNDYVSSKPLWLSKRQEILHAEEQVSDDQALNVEMQQSTTSSTSLQSPLEEEEVAEPVSRIFCELNGDPSANWDKNTNASLDDASHAINDEIPLWLKRRPGVMHDEEKPLQEGDDFNDASNTFLNGAPAWMTRFKQLEKE